MHELSAIALVDVRGVIHIIGEEVIQRGGHSSGKAVVSRYLIHLPIQ